jgi:hypothetical protein
MNGKLVGEIPQASTTVKNETIIEDRSGVNIEKLIQEIYQQGYHNFAEAHNMCVYC